MWNVDIRKHLTVKMLIGAGDGHFELLFLNFFFGHT